MSILQYPFRRAVFLGPFTSNFPELRLSLVAVFEYVSLIVFVWMYACEIVLNTRERVDSLQGTSPTHAPHLLNTLVWCTLFMFINILLLLLLSILYYYYCNIDNEQLTSIFPSQFLIIKSRFATSIHQASIIK